MANRTYTTDQREMAIAAWVDKGTYRKASEVVKIPWETIREWHRSHTEWWERKADEYRQLKEPEKQALLNEILQGSARALLDRLEHGDVRLTTKGEQVRVPVSARDAATIYGIATDKYRISLGQPTSIQGKQEATTGDRLAALKEMAKPKAVADVSELQFKESDAA